MDKGYMKQLAQLLGVEIGETFKLHVASNKHKNIVYRITEKGLESKAARSTSFYPSDLAVNRLYPSRIKKIPQMPSYGEEYYYPDFIHGVGENIWTDSEKDLKIARTVGAFKQREKALEVAKKRGWA